MSGTHVIPSVRSALRYLLAGGLITTLLPWCAASDIELAGSSRLMWHSASRQGSGQALPADFLRLDMNTRLAFYGIPIGMDLLLSTEQEGSLQKLNSFQLHLDSRRAWGQRLRQKQQQAETFAHKFLSWFALLNVGSCYPHYSPLTLSGIPVTGLQAAIDPGEFFFAVSGGRTRRPIEGSAYGQKLVATQFGIGCRRYSHWYLTLLHAWDEEDSIEPDTTYALTPQENYLLATEVRLRLFSNRLLLDGEVAAAMLIADIYSPEMITDGVPDWLYDIVHPKGSSSVDYAYAVKGTYDWKQTKLLCATRMVGPGYCSPGAPFLRADERTYEACIDQGFLNRQASLSGYIRRSEDNLVPWKESKTISTAYGVTANLRRRGWPHLQVNYAPYFQNNDSLSTDNETSLIALLIGHNLYRSGLNLSTNLYFSRQQGNSASEESNFTNQQFSLNESVTFRIPLTIFGTFSLCQTEYSEEQDDLHTIALGGSYFAFGRWRNALGVEWTSMKDKNDLVGFYWRSSYPVGWAGRLEVHLRNNAYRDDADDSNDYDEWVFRSTLMTNW